MMVQFSGTRSLSSRPEDYSDPQSIWLYNQRHVLCLTQEIIENLYILRKDVCPDGVDRVHLPVNLKRLIWNAQKMFKCEPHKKKPTKLDPRHIIEKVNGIGDKIVVGVCFVRVLGRRLSLLKYIREL